MMRVQALVKKSWPKAKTGFVCAVLVGLVLGGIGGGVGEPWVAVVSSSILLILFGAYNQTLKHNNGLFSGLIAGGIVGFFVSLAGLPISRNINGIIDGALFGLLSGTVAGAVIGVITHARPHENDKLPTKIFLVTGSIGLGAFLGGGVGVVAGTILGLINAGWHGTVLAAVAGAIVGGYLGSYYKNLLWISLGGIILACLSIISSLVGGALAGLILGVISGSFAPMLFVALIGAYGGLFSRGVVAMIVEALEAPSEMLTQGAVPYLVPAMMVGMIVGTAASGVGGLIVLPASLAVVGLMLGVFGELEGKPNNQVTVRTIVEMTMMGAEDWPVRQVVHHVARQNYKDALLGAASSLLLGLLGCGAGIYMGQWVRQLVSIFL